MTAASTVLLSLSSTARWLTGPIFGKELRVASRRRRSYALRFAYVGLLTTVLVRIWLSYVHPGGGGSVYQASRLGTAGQYIAIAIIWSQFVAAQLAALVLLFDAISGEIRKRTLHVLAVTPISSMQIVLGKLAGGLLHIMMLLAISLPLLALVRVFGGVPWDYVLSGICITCTATVFMATLTLFTSVLHRPWCAALVQPLWYSFFLFPGAESFIGIFARLHPAIGALGNPVVLLISPTSILLAQTRDLLAARLSTGLSSWWPLHCLILLAGSAVVLLVTARRVRAVAAEPPSACLSGYGMGKSPAHLGNGANRTRRSGRKRAHVSGPIRRVEGSPILWKELRNFAVWNSRNAAVVYGAPAAGGCLWVAVLTAAVVTIGGSYRIACILALLAGSILGFHGAFIMVLAATAAGGLSREREARTLPVLLTTPLGDEEIVRDKAIAALRRALPLLIVLSVLLLFGSIFLIAGTSETGPLAIAYSAGLYIVTLLGIVPFLLGLGLCCGVWLKTAGAAIGCTSAVAYLGLLASIFAAIKFVRPLLLGGSRMWLTVSVLVISAALACASIGLVLMRIAARQLRRNIF